jgi:hypothetical protein
VVGTLTASSEAGAPTNESEAQSVKPHVSELEFASHVAVTGISMAAGGATAKLLKGAGPLLRGAASGYTSGFVQGAGEQGIEDAKKGQISSPKTYLKKGHEEGKTQAVFGAALEGAGAFVKKAIPGIKKAPVATAATPEGKAPHVGGSPKVVPKQKVTATVADAGKDKCVGNVCAIMKNTELKAGPESGYTVKELETELGLDLGRTKSGAPNPLVATPDRAIGTIERVTGLTATNPKNPVNFATASAEGQYAIFLNDSHVVYARIRAGGQVSILDANVGKGWSSWKDFLKYAENNPTLYGANPGKANKAFHFTKKN